MNGAILEGYRDGRLSRTLVHTFARGLVFKMMEKLEYGQIIVKDTGKTFIFGHDAKLQAQITVHSPSFYPKVLLGGSIGAGEAYFEGLWDADDLTAVIRIMVLNMKLLERMEKGLALLMAPLRLAAHHFKNNSRGGARKNILAHYDLGNDMYAAFLDETMMYSSAIYPSPESSLETASENKLDIICKKLQLQPQDHVIEIGSGWGGFAIHAASRYGCRVTTTTLSEAQYSEAKRRVEKAGLSDRITLLRRDYRDLEGSYDKLVSIEMIEAVGHRYLPLFFSKCNSLLKKNGIMLLQAITIGDQQFNSYVRSVDFIQHHIFPGGCLLSNAKMVDLIASKTDMVVRGLEDFGLHYARTLQDWRRRFNDSFQTLQGNGFDERFRRLWQFYLCYCEGGFLERSISVVHLVASKPAHRRDTVLSGHGALEM